MARLVNSSRSVSIKILCEFSITQYANGSLDGSSNFVPLDMQILGEYIKVNRASAV